ncbi:MAG: nuclear transport factor 2 family protein [Clostridia bacterium]
MWVARDFSNLHDIFDENIYYSECYGPEYFDLNEIYLWIDDMLKKQIVLEWTIKRIIHADEVSVVEWFFKEQQGDVVHRFDGVSLIEFTPDHKISVIKEFESKSEHIAPYHV